MKFVNLLENILALAICIYIVALSIMLAQNFSYTKKMYETQQSKIEELCNFYENN